MTCEDAAALWGLALSTVQRWARKGMIEGVTRVRARSGTRYEIPNDAKMPDVVLHPKRKNSEEHCRQLSPEQYITLYGGMQSGREIADRLGISTREVRRIYDRIGRL